MSDQAFVTTIGFGGYYKYTVKLGTSMTNYWICNLLKITNRKLSCMARKYNGKFQSRYKGGNTYVVFDKEEDAQKLADDINAMLVSKKLSGG